MITKHFSYIHWNILRATSVRSMPVFRGDQAPSPYYFPLMESLGNLTLTLYICNHLAASNNPPPPCKTLHPSRTLSAWLRASIGRYQFYIYQQLLKIVIEYFNSWSLLQIHTKSIRHQICTLCVQKGCRVHIACSWSSYNYAQPH